MDQQKQQIVERLTQANNILVTVSTNPSVDQLSACIGLTLALNKLGKHAAAVFSGEVPSTIEFLQPEKTLEKNTDSLRDFIIALDKSKADKLRYKVEDKVVKIFITPYKTSISEKDLEFSQGDFNVDVVVALGVHSQADIDKAITAHGRILHDAVVVTINTKTGGELGAINWVQPTASSLSELVVQALEGMDKKVFDSQMATALLTGIVAETQRFSNAKTTPQTMAVSAELMAAGANQQLVATKLEPPKPVAPPPPPPAPPKPQITAPVTPVAAVAPQSTAPAASAPKAEPPKTNEGMLEIEHEVKGNTEEQTQENLGPQIAIDKEGTLRRIEELEAEREAEAHKEEPAHPDHSESQRRILQQQSTAPPVASPVSSVGNDPLSLPQPAGGEDERPSGAPPLPPPDSFGGSIRSHNFVSPLSAPSDHAANPLPPAPVPGGSDGRTLSQIEQDVGSPHITQAVGNPPQQINEPAASPFAPPPAQNPNPVPSTGGTQAAADDAGLSSARDAVHQAIGAQPAGMPEPVAALNALPVDLPLRDQPADNTPASPTAPPGGSGVVVGPAPGFSDNPQQSPDPNAPPPGPPPMMPPMQ